MRIITPIFIVVIFLFSGCSIVSNFYIRNMTNEATSIMVKSFERVDSLRFEFVFTNDQVNRIEYGEIV